MASVARLLLLQWPRRLSLTRTTTLAPSANLPHRCLKTSYSAAYLGCGGASSLGNRPTATLRTTTQPKQCFLPPSLCALMEQWLYFNFCGCSANTNFVNLSPRSIISFFSPFYHFTQYSDIIGSLQKKKSVQQRYKMRKAWIGRDNWEAHWSLWSKIENNISKFQNILKKIMMLPVIYLTNEQIFNWKQFVVWATQK
jgi:hypothetical protein